MPLGIIINVLTLIFAGICGTLLGDKIKDEFKTKIIMIFGLCAMGMGVSTIILMENLSAVVFSIIIGTVIGHAVHLEEKIQSGAGLMQKGITKFIKNKNTNMTNEDYMQALVTIIVLCCASGTGIYGAIISGMNGDHTILITKSILDFFTGLIFACSLGLVVSLIAIPQSIIFLILFFGASLIFPLTTPAMINDFRACGGFLILATGFRMINVKMFPVADMIPAMIVVMPMSWIWQNYVLVLMK